MNLDPDLLRRLHVSEEEIALFRANHPGFCGFDSSRISGLLAAQLASVSQHRTFNSFSVTDVIQQLEGVGRRGCAKGAEPFKHSPLKGLWKAHFFDARFLITNLFNHWGLGYEESPKFNALCSRIAVEEETTPTPHGWQGRLAHEFTVSAYDDRAAKKKLTGEWIVFSKYGGSNYYLCIAKHSTSKEDDKQLWALITTCCTNEYPFLFGNAV